MEQSKKVISLASLDKAEYNDGANLAFQNANNLLEIAKFCSKKRFDGNGAALLVTALEELSKAAYLKIKSHNPHIVIKELERLFKNHKIKHQTIIFLYTKSLTNSIKSRPIEEQNSAAFVAIVGLMIIGVLLAKNNQTVDLEKVRQQGYYVDFTGDENYWKSPVQLISSEVFKDYIVLTESVFENVKKDLFEGELTDIHSRQYITELGDKDVYFRKTYNF